MLLPLIFLVISCVSFVILGLVLLASVPSFRLTVLNLIVFILGAVPGAILFLFLFGKLLPHEQFSDRAIYELLLVPLVGAVSLGGLAVSLKMRFTNTRDINSSR